MRGVSIAAGSERVQLRSGARQERRASRRRREGSGTIQMWLVRRRRPWVVCGLAFWWEVRRRSAAAARARFGRARPAPASGGSRRAHRCTELGAAKAAHGLLCVRVEEAGGDLSYVIGRGMRCHPRPRRVSERGHAALVLRRALAARRREGGVRQIHSEKKKKAKGRLGAKGRGLKKPPPPGDRLPSPSRLERQGGFEGQTC